MTKLIVRALLAAIMIIAVVALGRWGVIDDNGHAIFYIFIAILAWVNGKMLILLEDWIYIMTGRKKNHKHGRRAGDK